MKPSRSAMAMAWTRVLASSLFIALRMWVLIVSGDRNSRSATCSPVRPWASRSMISRSRLERAFCVCVACAGEQRGVQARVDVRAALGDRPQRGRRARLRAVLERVAARAGVQAADQQLDLARAGVEHDRAAPGRRRSAARSGRCRTPRRAGCRSARRPDRGARSARGPRSRCRRCPAPRSPRGRAAARALRGGLGDPRSAQGEETCGIARNSAGTRSITVFARHSKVSRVWRRTRKSSSASCR